MRYQARRLTDRVTSGGPTPCRAPNGASPTPLRRAGADEIGRRGGTGPRRAGRVRRSTNETPSGGTKEREVLRCSPMPARQVGGPAERDIGIGQVGPQWTPRRESPSQCRDGPELTRIAEDNMAAWGRGQVRVEEENVQMARLVRSRGWLRGRPLAGCFVRDPCRRLWPRMQPAAGPIPNASRRRRGSQSGGRGGIGSQRGRWKTRCGRARAAHIMSISRSGSHPSSESRRHGILLVGRCAVARQSTRNRLTTRRSASAEDTADVEPDSTRSMSGKSRSTFGFRLSSRRTAGKSRVQDPGTTRYRADPGSHRTPPRVEAALFWKTRTNS